MFRGGRRSGTEGRARSAPVPDGNDLPHARSGGKARAETFQKIQLYTPDSQADTRRMYAQMSSICVQKNWPLMGM